MTGLPQFPDRSGFPDRKGFPEPTGDPARGAARDVLARALHALPAAPRPPPFARVLAAARDPHTNRRLRLVPRIVRSVPATWALAAGVLAVVGLAGLLLLGNDASPTSPEIDATPPTAGLALRPARPGPLETFGVVTSDASSVRVRRATGAASPADAEEQPKARGGADTREVRVGETRLALHAGDEVTAVTTATLRLRAEGVVATLEPGAAIEGTDDASLVHQREGRAAYHVVRRDATPWRVRAGGVEVVDVSTRFGVDVETTTQGRRVLVWVDEGEVAVDGARLAAGRGRVFLDGAAVGPDWPIDARPELSLEVETADATTTAPVVLRIVLENGTDAWMALPRPGASEARAALWVEVTGPDDVVRPVRVTEAMRLGAVPPTAVPPRGRYALRVQFDRTFASPGTYRLRAVFRPADAVDPPRSGDVALVVR